MDKKIIYDNKNIKVKLIPRTIITYLYKEIMHDDLKKCTAKQFANLADLSLIELNYHYLQ